MQPSPNVQRTPVLPQRPGFTTLPLPIMGAASAILLVIAVSLLPMFLDIRSGKVGMARPASTTVAAQRLTAFWQPSIFQQERNRRQVVLVVGGLVLGIGGGAWAGASVDRGGTRSARGTKPHVYGAPALLRARALVEGATNAAE